MSNVQWRRSTRCANGACLEVGADWTRSTRCASGSCVECRHTGTDVLVRDSKLDDSPVLRFSPLAWKEFTEGVRAGDFS